MDVNKHAFWWLNSGGAAPEGLSKISVLFGGVYGSYLASNALYGAFQTGSNVIYADTISPDADTPISGLTYDIANDEFYLKKTTSPTIDVLNRSLVSQRTLAGPTGQAIAFDPTTRQLINVLTAIKKYNGLTGNEDESLALPSLGFTPDEGCFYDYVTGTLYLSPETSAPNNQKRLQKVAGVWTITDQSWFRFGGPFSIGYVNNKMIHIDPSFLIYRDKAYPNLNIRTAQLPLAAMQGTNGEQMLLDPRDGTIWQLFPGKFHGSITDGDGIFHTDPFELYRRYVRFPDMIRFDAFDIGNGTIEGLYGNQTVTGAASITSPVIDFGANTDQQDIDNWSGGIFEFRGSGNPPDTTSTPASDYLLLPYYDANQSNQGWGTTVPGSWQSTPTTDRYMQFRVAGQASAPSVSSWEPTDLGSVLKLHFDFTDSGKMYYNSWDSGRVPKIINLAKLEAGQASNNSIVQTTTSQQPIFNVDKVEMIGSNRNGKLEAITDFSTDQAGEFIIVAARNVNTSQGIFAAITKTTTNNDQFILNHTRAATDSPINTIGLEFVDSAGNKTSLGYVDTSTNDFSMICINSDGSTIKIYKNKVEQTVIVTGAAANEGQWIGDIAPNWFGLGFRTASTILAGQTTFKYLGYVSGRVLTSQERSDFYDWLVDQGII